MARPLREELFFAASVLYISKNKNRATKKFIKDKKTGRSETPCQIFEKNAKK